MLKKFALTWFGQARTQTVQVDRYKTIEVDVLTTQELERRRFYERLAHHQRIAEIEEEQRRRF
jgi:hypothetical protein